jgi:V8-like Glu-specific endopeptidase
MTRLPAFGLAAAMAMGVAAAVPAQVAVFDAGDYGQTDLVFRESTGNASAYIAAQDGAFEPIRELPKDDPIRHLAAAIGRLDLLELAPDGTRGLVTCTGAILPGGWVLTNHHCIPNDSDHRLLAASILTGYLVQGDEGAKRYTLSVAPEDWHDVLDFSLVRMQDIADDILPLILTQTAVDPGDSLTVIHHPLGRPQVMTRFRCFAIREQQEGPILRHRCDTQPGSSGSILFNREMIPVALHHSGGMTPNDDKSFNKSTRISAILQASELLQSITGASPMADSPAVSPEKAPQTTPEITAPDTGLSAGGINDMLRGN